MSSTLANDDLESDLDVVVLTPQKRSPSDSVQEILEIFSCLCETIRESEQNLFPYDFVEFKIQSVEFVNARTRVIKCIINKMNLDITVNQRGSLASAAFLEEADRIIGHNHIYKRSVLLVKAWCLHESKRYCGVSISGSKGGMLSSYALSVLVLYVFSTHEFRTSTAADVGTENTSCNVKNVDPLLRVHPLDVLRAFLKIFSTFQWESFVVTLEGPAVIKTGNLSTPSLDLSDSSTSKASNHTLVQMLRAAALKAHDAIVSRRTESEASAAAAGGAPNTFPVRCCNIADPVDGVNNLGVPVSWRNLKLIKTALDGGSQHLEAMLSSHFIPRNQSTVSRNKGSNSPSLVAIDPCSVLGTPHSGIAPGLTLPPRPPAHLSHSPLPTLQPPPPLGPPPMSSSMLPIAPAISASSFSAMCGNSCAQSAGHLMHPLKGVIADQWMTQQPSQLSYASVTAPVMSTLSPQDRGLMTPSMAFVRSYFSGCFNAYHLDSIPPLSLHADKHASMIRNPTSSGEPSWPGSGFVRQRSHSYSTATTTSSTGPCSNDSSPDSSRQQLSLVGDLESMWSSLQHVPPLMDDDCKPRTPSHNSQQQGQSAHLKHACEDMVVDVECTNDASTDGEHHSPFDSTTSWSASVLEDPASRSYISDGDSTGCTQTRRSPSCGDLFSISTRFDSSPEGSSAKERRRRGKGKESPESTVSDTISQCSNRDCHNIVPNNKSKRKKGTRASAVSSSQGGGQEGEVCKSGGSGKVDGVSRVTSADDNISSDDDIAVMKARINQSATSTTYPWSNNVILAISGAVAFVAVGMAAICSHSCLFGGDVSSNVSTDGALGSASSLWLPASMMPHDLTVASRRVAETLLVPSKSVKEQTPYDALLSSFDGDVFKMESSMQVGEIWLRGGDNVTLGLNDLSQDILYYYMSNDVSVRGRSLVGQKLSAMWLKDGEAYTREGSFCESDPYLPLINVNATHTAGLYSFVVVSDYPRVDVCESPPIESVVKVLAKTSVKIGVAPSCKTKPKHLILHAGASQLYLHVQVDGAPSPSIQWFKNGIPIPNEVKSNLIVNNVDKSHEGTYSCELRNMAGTYTWLEATVIVK